MNKRLKAILRSNSKALESSEKNFKALYSIMFNQDAVLSEYTDGYRICTQTYKETAALIEEASCALKDKIGSTHGYVALDMENCPEWIVAFWSILRSGNKPYLVNCRHPKALSQAALERLNITYIIGKDSTNLSGEFIDITSLKTDNRFEGEFEDEIALSTSATSLKEVICFYNGAKFSEQILNVQSFIGSYPEIAAQHNGRIKQLAFLPFYHIFGLVAVYFWFTFYGQTMVFLKNMSPETIVKTCQKHEVTHIFGVPLLWHTIEKTILRKVKQKGEKTQNKFQKGLKLCTKLQNIFPHWGMKLSQKIMKDVTSELFGNSVKFCISGGSFLRQSALELFNGIGYNLHNGYGMTEIGITSVELRMKPKYKNLNSIGVPFASVQYKINENGTLMVKGSSICDKIWIEGEEVNSDEWFDTGDMVQYRDGRYYMAGRSDDLIVCEDGENLNPTLAEAALATPGIDKLCVFRRADKRVALVASVPGCFAADRIAALFAALSEKIAAAKLERVIRTVYFTGDALLAPGEFKLSRSSVAARIESGALRVFSPAELGERGEALFAGLEQDLAALFAEVLGKDVAEIGRDSHFFRDLGGTSMDYYALLGLIRGRLGAQIEVAEAAELATVAQLYAYLTK